MQAIRTLKRFASQSAATNIWQLGKLNHIAIAVPNIEKSMKFYKDVLGADVGSIQPQEEHGVYTVFVTLGESKIELLYPLGEKSPIKAFLEKNKSGGMHHVCLEVSNLEEAMKTVKANNIRTLSKESKIGAHGKPVIFLHPKDCDGTLVELEEM